MHPEVMHDYGGPISRSEGDAKLDRYMAIYQEHGFSGQSTVIQGCMAWVRSVED